MDIKKIGIESLNSCISEIGYTAGVHHFVDLWARDSLFACLGDSEGVETKKTINTFLKHQRKDGLIPYRIRRSSLSIKKYFGKPEMLKIPVADFRSFQSGFTVYDGGITTILIFSEYVNRFNDVDFLESELLNIQKAIAFYRKRFKDGLIWEGPLCEWADAVLKFGNVAYTNIIYVASIKRFIEILELNKGILGDEISSYIIELKDFYEKLRDRLFTRLWNGTYFSDWYDYKRHNYFGVHHNMLAILFGLTTDEQSRTILEKVSKECLDEVGVRSNFPKYPKRRIPIQNFLVGVGDYHNGIYWIQPWILYIAALKKFNMDTQAKEQLGKLETIIKRDGIVYENYDYDWKYTNRKFYRSEGPFAWNSGLIVWVCNMFN